MKFVIFLILLVLVGAANCAPQDCVSKEDFNQVLKTLLQRMAEQDQEIAKLQENNELQQFLLNDTTVEERVTILEFQMSRVFDDITQISSDVTDLNSDVTNINGDVNNLADDVRDLDDDIESQLTIVAAEQVLQDERMLAIESNDQGVQDSIIALQTADTALTSDVTRLDGRVSDLNGTVLDLGGRVGELEGRVGQLEGRVDILEFNVTLTDKLKINHLKNNKIDVPTEPAESQSLNNVTIEERVAILEFQVDVINADVTQISADVSGVSADVTAVSDDISRLEDDVRDLDDDLEAQLTLISGEQVLQDDRIFTLEQNEEALFSTVTDLQAADVSINSRVSTLNASLTDLISTVRNLENITDQRLSKLELSGTVAFHADLNQYTEIPVGSLVAFDLVTLNVGNGYDVTTGQFRVPPGGAGLYYFYIHFHAEDAKVTNFQTRLNGAIICHARSDHSESSIDNGNPSCGVAVSVSEGDVVDVLYSEGTDNLPVVNDNLPYNTFTGFRLAPA